MHTVAVVLAGGTGRRFGAGLPKQMRLLDGRSLVPYLTGETGGDGGDPAGP